MTRLSATATIAALLLLAIAQGFGATKVTTKSTAKVATKSTAKPYHITAQNQFHITSAKRPSKALARLQSKAQPTRGPHGKEPSGAADKRRMANLHTMTPRRAMTARPRTTANPPTGKIGFVSATQVSAAGDDYGQVQAGTLGGLTAFITVVWNGACSYSEVAANGDGTFTAPAAVLTPTVSGNCNPAFIVGDLDGDGNTDIIEADTGTSSLTVLMSNGDGTFTAGTPFVVTGATGLTGGALVLNATSTFLDAYVVDDSTPSNLIVIPGNGDGTFGTPAAPVPLVPAAGQAGVGYGVILADFDGDGLIDVAENDFNTNQVNVYLAATTVAYTGVALTTPDTVYDGCSSTAGSLTGSVAIVETNCSDDTITVYNNDGTGAFSAGVYYPVILTSFSVGNGYPEAATIADVNGDGNGDVIVVGDDSSDAVILTGNGDGTVNSASVGYAMGGYLFNPPIVADLNGDGLMDILAADDNQGFVWMAGYGDGTFQASKNYYDPIPDNSYSTYGISVATGDFNGDGIPDVVVGNCCDNSIGITVFLSNPDGSLQPGLNYGSGGGMYYVTVADFNGDGKLDIAVSDNFNDTVDIYTGLGTGTFIAGPTYSVGGGMEGITSGAINTAGTSGFADLAVVSYNCCPSGSLTVLVNDGTGAFGALAPVALAGGGYELTLGDVDGDGNLDVAVAESSGSQVGVLLGVGDGTFGAETDVPVGGSPYGIALADVDGDGNLDIVTDSGSSAIAVVLGVGDGTFPGANTMIMPASLEVLTGFNYNPDPTEIKVADVDGDGVADLVYTNADYGTVGVLFGTGTGSLTATPPTPYFFDPVEFPTGQWAYGINLNDLNGDGMPDAVTADDDFAGVSVLINANGSAAAPNYSLSSSGAFLNITDGGTGTATITLTPVNFYSGTVTFSCTGLSLDMTCTFAPASLTPVGNAALTTTVTVTTKAPHGALRMPADPHQGRTSLLACLTGMGLFGLLLAGDWKNKRNRRVGILLGILVLGMMFSLVGCSSSKPGTPLGAQTVTIQGTGSDGVANSVAITVNVF